VATTAERRSAEGVEGDVDILTRFETWASTRPTAPFLYYGPTRQTFTFAEFDGLARRIQGALIELGATATERIATVLNSNLTTSLTMVGAWKANLVYAPVSPHFHGLMLHHQLSDSRPSIVVADRRSLPLLDSVLADVDSIRTLVVVEDDPLATAPLPGGYADGLEVVSLGAAIDAAGTGTLPPLPRHAKDPVEIIYTSGTTGAPKGVVHPRRWLSHHTYAMRSLLTHDDVVYTDLPMCHIGGAVSNFARAMSAGCGVAMWDRFSTTEFWTRVAESRSTTAILIDVMIEWLRKSATSGDSANTLNKAYLQPLRSDHLDIAKRFGIDFVQAGFGMTESGGCVYSLIEELPEGSGTPKDLYHGYSHDDLIAVADAVGIAVERDPSAVDGGYMGRPLPYISARIVDDDDHEVADGEPGELVFRSDEPWVLFDGYLGQPEATVRAMRNQWFHTGDICRRAGADRFHFIDRRSYRIRRRGENISTFHIESVIQAHPTVDACAVLPVPEIDGDEDEIALFVTPVDGSTLSADEVRAWSEDRLPRFMVPLHITVVDELPRTPTSKVEKAALARFITSLQEAAR